MPADGVVIAKEAFRFVEQSQAYHGTKEAFRLRDEHFHVPEPGSP
jgi:enoyl-CoA hydratase